MVYYKNKNQLKFLIIVLFLFSLSLGNLISFNETEKVDLLNREDLQKFTLRTAQISERIHINNNWSDAKDDGICTGSGTFSDPYVIENLIIDCGGSGSGIFIENSKTEFFIINNCTIYNAGIKLSKTSNGTLINNWCINNAGAGIFLDNSNNITVKSNNLNNNQGLGIYLNKSHDNFILFNNISFSRNGIVLYMSNYNQIVGNKASNGYYGINIGGTFNNISMNFAENNYYGIKAGSYNNISYNQILNNYYDAISCGYNNRIYKNIIIGSETGLYLSNRQNSIYNNSMYNTGFEIYGSIGEISSNIIDTSNLVNDKPVYFYANENGLLAENFTNEGQPGQIILFNCSNSQITNIDINNSSNGMIIHYCSNVTISGNNLANNTIMGIDLRYSENSTIFNNEFESNKNAGLFMRTSHNNNLTENRFSKGSRGIYMGNCNNNLIQKNFLTNQIVLINSESAGSGIDLYNSYFNLLIENTACNNIKNGITLGHFDHDGYGSNNNSIIGNNLSSNGQNGIYIEGNNNNITGNNLIYGNDAGIKVISSSMNNYIYNNTFLNNNLNARDDGIDNYWDYNQIGNYWDDYTGFDIDDDGIGEDPYNIIGYAGSQDHYPLATEASQAPTIISHYPLQNDIFGKLAPKFNVTCLDIHLNETWYSINGGGIYFFFQNGTINQLEWESQGDGPTTLRFYANDTLGNLNFKDITVIKDTQAPLIELYYPDMNDCFNNNPPYVFITPIDDHLDSMWYSVNGGKNITFNIVSIINQSEWEPHSDGLIIVTFFSNDTAGNLAFKEINVIKDTILPIIEINFPPVNENFGIDAPNYSVTVKDENLDLMWYTLDGGFHNYTFTTNGTINQNAWSSILEGSVKLQFYAMDKTGKIGYAEITINKKEVAIPGYNLWLLVMSVFIFSLIIMRTNLSRVLIKKK